MLRILLRLLIAALTSILLIQVALAASKGTVSSGMVHSLSVKNDGTVWAFGSNSVGQLGNGSINSSTVPVQVSWLTDAMVVAAGTVHSLALASNGTVWAWGGE